MSGSFGKVNLKVVPWPGCAVNLDLTAVGFNQPLNNRQTEADTAVMAFIPDRLFSPR